MMVRMFFSSIFNNYQMCYIWNSSFGVHQTASCNCCFWNLKWKISKYWDLEWVSFFNSTFVYIIIKWMSYMWYILFLIQRLLLSQKCINCNSEIDRSIMERDWRRGGRRAEGNGEASRYSLFSTIPIPKPL